MSDHELLIRRFYEAFNAKDSKTMQASYHKDARFSDPVFPDLRGKRIGLMWEMLVTSARDLEIDAGEFRPGDETLTCRWEAKYTFSKTARPVHNVITASFIFKDGLILRHIDQFNFYRWSRQALGLSGVLLGWTPILRSKVQKNAAASLENFIKRRSP